GCTRIGDYEVPKSKIGGLYDMTYVTLDIVVHVVTPFDPHNFARGHHATSRTSERKAQRRV
ncbi:hypothetical protein TELCIR_17834, partial [Teladorsagia circumcincta]